MLLDGWKNSACAELMSGDVQFIGLPLTSATRTKQL
jgi:hypothetical protein